MITRKTIFNNINVPGSEVNELEIKRYLLDITFLVILLIPNIALSCKNRNLNMTEVMNDFQYIISQDFEDLKALLDSKVYNISYIEPQRSKHSLCSDGREIDSIHHMTCSTVSITNKFNFDFTPEIMALSRKTEGVLKCHCKRQKHQKTNIRKSKTPTNVIPRRKTKSAQKKFLRIKNKISDLYLCWKKMYKFTR
ncbi:uncharacterized protein LOC134355504 isoform X2 [Mobula hypostoma]|uniref:uncharacterized protein LOC134355504 isoform X2 n=1 Tax=Mobula hypostoma TaxID=723540 RepID=UPI002FC38B88